MRATEEMPPIVAPTAYPVELRLTPRPRRRHTVDTGRPDEDPDSCAGVEEGAMRWAW
ncbi:hypothetical protein [Streptomyces sp. NPDC048568]|uniref:hypothetical protein n=1 Tax=Streptomyces sp. NPDC048568 TaxID=3365571 RepID=UPI00371ECB5E